MSKAVLDSTPTGIGVIIDNCVHTEDSAIDSIADLVAQIEEAGIPCVKYDRLPKPDSLPHFGNVAFILLDWEIWEKPVEDPKAAGVYVGGELEEQGIKRNITFLKSLKRFCFTPVFIFSYLAPDPIKKILSDNGLFDARDDRNFILVRSKDELKRKKRDGSPLLDAVGRWIEGNPAIYVLTRWKNVIAQAQNSLFWELYVKDPGWPGVLWNTYETEGADPEHGLADILLRNLRARLFPLSLQPGLVKPPGLPSIGREAIMEVIEASMLVPDKQLPRDQYGSGDIFKGTKGRFWINIRCDCNFVNLPSAELDEVELYLLEAKPIRDKDLLKDFFKDTHGIIQGNSSCHIVYSVSRKALRVDFSELYLKPVGELRSKRIGRLMPPYITHIRQRYALYLQREALPRIPNEALPALTP